MAALAAEVRSSLHEPLFSATLLKLDYMRCSSAAIKALVVSAKISTPEVALIWAEGTKSRIITWRVMKIAVVLWMVAEAVISISCSIIHTSAKAVMFCLLYERRNSLWRRWRRRRYIVGPLLRASCREEHGC
jgi:hypothetical protein